MRRAFICAIVIASGLALRRFGPATALPFFVVKYGGSLLWGSMVYFLVALALDHVTPRRLPIVSAAMAIVVGVEFFRLFHTPALDAFRLTTAGALLLGRVFSLWNILAYGAGIIAAVAIDALAAHGAHPKVTCG